jgi:hypothetical protein
MSRFFVGVDLGQVRDPTAIAVVEATGVLRVRHLERIALKTKYMQVVERVRRVSRCKQLKGKCEIVSDATGVGRPVAEMLQASKLGGKLLPVLVTRGENESGDDEYCGVPKRDLIVGLAEMMLSGEVHLAGGLQERRALENELKNMEVRQIDHAYHQYAAWRRGEHDDMVFAIALACWAAKRKPAAGKRGLADQDGNDGLRRPDEAKNERNVHLPVS